MKKFYAVIIAVVVMGLCFSSCNKPEKLIIGKWKIEEQKVDKTKVSSAEGEVWSFTDDNKFKGHIDGNDFSGKYSCEDDELILSGGDFTDKNIDQIVFEIESISKKAMTLNGKVKTSQGGNNNYDPYDDYDWKNLTEGTKITVELEKKK